MTFPYSMLQSVYTREDVLCKFSRFFATATRTEWRPKPRPKPTTCNTIPLSLSVIYNNHGVARRCLHCSTSASQSYGDTQTSGVRNSKAPEPIYENFGVGNDSRHAKIQNDRPHWGRFGVCVKYHRRVTRPTHARTYSFNFNVETERNRTSTKKTRNVWVGA